MEIHFKLNKWHIDTNKDWSLIWTVDKTEIFEADCGYSGGGACR